MAQRLYSARWFLLAIVVVSFVLTYLVRARELAGSTIIFFVEGNEHRPAEETGKYYQNTFQLRVYHLATSSAMLDHLVRTFSLAEHYSTVGPDQIRSAMDVLLTRVEVRVIDEISQSITIRDEDPVLAERMVNEAFRKLDAMLEEQRSAFLERNAAVNRRLLASTEAQAREHMNSVYSMLTELRSAARVSDGKSPVDNSVEQLLASLAASRSALFDLRMDVERSSIILDEKLPPTVEVLRNATEDDGSRLWRSLRVAIGWAAIMLIVSLGAIVLWHFHWKDLREVLMEELT